MQSIPKEKNKLRHRVNWNVLEGYNKEDGETSGEFCKRSVRKYESRKRASREQNEERKGAWAFWEKGLSSKQKSKYKALRQEGTRHIQRTARKLI